MTDQIQQPDNKNKDTTADTHKASVLDANVIAVLPPGCEVLDVSQSGHSLFVNTHRIDCRLEDGTLKSYFMKSSPSPKALALMRCSFESESLFHGYSPSHVPRPLTWGSFFSSSSSSSSSSSPTTYFLLCDFHTMSADGPPHHRQTPDDFLPVLVDIHKSSMAVGPPVGLLGEPENRFDFHVTTHLGDVPNDNTPRTKWEGFFAQLMRRMVEVERGVNGDFVAGEELEREVGGGFNGLYDIVTDIERGDLFTKIIQAVLRPLEIKGRRVKPCLVHSDLVIPGNIARDVDTGRVMLFDSCGFWGHHEADLGTWRNEQYGFGGVEGGFVEGYKRLMGGEGVSEPVEMWDVRNALYALRYTFLLAIIYPKEARVHRGRAYREIVRLGDMFPNGYQEEEN